MNSKRTRLICLRLVALVVGVLCVWGVLRLTGTARAQETWTPPDNLSSSGSASQPAIAVTSDGTIHTLWWDTFDGALYARVSAATGTLMSRPVSVQAIVGERRVDQKTGQVTVLSAPRDVRLAAGANGSVHALWFATGGELMTASSGGLQWGQAITLSEGVIALDTSSDEKQTTRLAYARSAAPAGIYVRANTGTGWTAPVSVTQSPYMRTAKADAVRVSVAGQASGRVLVVWDDPLLEQSLYSYSSDNGATWSAGEPVIGRQPGRVKGAHVAAAANGEFLLIWQDATSGGCGLTQRRSSDGGTTWAAPERVLTNLTRCPARWQFSLAGDNRLWLLGLPAGDQESPAQVGTIAAWDGKAWSQPANVSVSFQSPATGKTATLACLGMSVAGGTLGISGCDDKGDVWASGNALGLDQLVPALQPAWEAPQVLSDGKGQAELPAVAAGADGRMYTMWSQQTGTTNGGASLYVAVWDGTRWGRATRVFATTANPVLMEADTQTRAEQPALAVDARGRLHAVWSGGTSGQIMYNWVYGREAASQSWADEQVIPSPTDAGAWPDIVADPRGDVLHVAYAVPYNEQRGVYYVRSQGRGELAIASWPTPTLVFDAVAAKWDSVSKVRLALDAAANTLHVVWLRSGLPGGATLQAVYYARSSDGGQTWSSAQKVMEGALDWPRVAVAGQQVHVLWNKLRSDGSAEVWDQYSTDRGVRWSQPAAVFGFSQLNGPAAAAADGAGALFLSGMGQGANGEAALLFARWDGAAWGRAESFGLGQTATAGNAVVAALSAKGDWLGVAARLSAMGQNGVSQFAITASGRSLQAAAIAPARAFTPLPSPTPPPTRTPQATATPALEFPLPVDALAVASDPIATRSPAILGGALGVAVVLGVFVARAIALGRKR